MINSLKGYVAVGAAFAALSVFGSLLWLNGSLRADLAASQRESAQATASLDKALQANAENTKALQTLAQYRALDNALLVSLQADMAKWDEKLKAAATNREELKRKDPDVKNFLALPIPAALRVPSPAKNDSSNKN